jgi:hypothetical protein
MSNGPLCHAGAVGVFAAAREDLRRAGSIVVCNPLRGALAARLVAA